MSNELIVENYEQFLKENSDDLSTPNDIVKLISDDGYFRSYKDALIESLDTDVRISVGNVLDRQREMLLTESANVAASSFAAGWVCLSFPILTDIYAEPLISQLCNVYPVSTPTITIPRVRIKATSVSYDGQTEITKYIPTATSLIRANEVVVNVAAGSNYNIYTGLDFTIQSHKINRRYTLMTQLTIEEALSGGGSVTHAVNVSFRPDARDQISREFSFTDNGGNIINGQVLSHITNQSGVVTVQVNMDVGASSSTFECTQTTFKLRFRPIKTNNGRTTVSVETESTDCHIDNCDDFILSLEQEDIQDFSSIYKIDLLRTITEAIKKQIALNKDYDLVYYLEAAESEIASFNAKYVVDLDNFTSSSTNYHPSTPIDIFKAVVPHIHTAMSRVKANYQRYPQYLVCGLKVAAMLRSLQSMMVNLSGMSGTMGFSGENAEFLKLKILESASMSEDKLFLACKAPSNALEQASIVDLVYQPLYIIKEITDGAAINFVRSRTALEIVRYDSIAMIQLLNLDKYIARND